MEVVRLHGRRSVVREDGQKLCPRCDKFKPLSEFPPDKRVPIGVGSWCRSCKAHRGRTRDRDDPEETRRRMRQKRLRAYGLSPADYDVMYARQEGRCAICDDRQETLCVDHDHETGHVRGLLCRACNFGIGLLGDTSASLVRAVEYLRPPEASERKAHK